MQMTGLSDRIRALETGLTSITQVRMEITGLSDRIRAVETGLTQQQQRTQASDEATAVPAVAQQPPLAAAPAPQVALPVQRTVDDTLRSNPRMIPAVPSALPQSMASLLTEDRVLDLPSLQVSNRTGWPDKVHKIALASVSTYTTKSWTRRTSRLPAEGQRARTRL